MPLSERAFQDQVTGLAEIRGWSWVHFRPALTGRGWKTSVSGPLGEGWPDLVLVRERDRRLIFAELKSDAGKPSDEQRRVLDILGALFFSSTCGEWPEGQHAGELYGAERRHGCCPPTTEVYLWRPGDFDVIEATLR